MVLDFAGVTYMNSTGIALIVGLLARARKNGQTLAARGLSEHYREIFEITRLADFMTILDDEKGQLDDERHADDGCPQRRRTTSRCSTSRATSPRSPRTR